MKTSDPLHEELTALADHYQHVTQSLAVLEPYKEPVLVLRAKYASYEHITEVLNQRGIQISLATVRKFCRKHNVEMKRMRHEIDEAKKDPSASSSSAVNPVLPGIPTETSRPPLTADAGQRGPRIARNDI